MNGEEVMANQQEVQVQEKKEVEKKQEGTIPGRVFIAVADIFETDQALTVVLEMPGVNKYSVDVRVENNLLSVEGRVDFSNYTGLNQSIPSTMSATMHEASNFPAKLNKMRLAPN
jgi:HSP20 family molecular chaperone IbpA